MARTKTPSTNKGSKKASDESSLELPEMKDIPGQEHIHNAGVPGEMADTTISSDDEEGINDGKDLLAEDEEEVEIVMGTEADVTKEDLALLGDVDEDMDMGEDEVAGKAALDDIDDEGDPLNESGSGASGKDLDIPGADENDPDSESRGQGDEENNFYSLGGDEKDDDDNGTPNEYRK